MNWFAWDVGAMGIFFIAFSEILFCSWEFLFFRHVYGIVHIHTDDRAVGRDLDNVHAVDVTELLLLGEGSTCHAGFFLVFVAHICN